MELLYNHVEAVIFFYNANNPDHKENVLLLYWNLQNKSVLEATIELKFLFKLMRRISRVG